jgi:hypothetical protein
MSRWQNKHSVYDGRLRTALRAGSSFACALHAPAPDLKAQRLKVGGIEKCPEK